MKEKGKQFTEACEEVLEKNDEVREYIEQILLTELLPKYDPEGKFTSEMIEELVYNFMIGMFKAHMVNWKKENNE